MAADSATIPPDPASSVRSAEAIRSPPRALVALSVLSGFAIAGGQGSRDRSRGIARKPAGNDRRPARGGFTIFVFTGLTTEASTAAVVGGRVGAAQAAMAVCSLPPCGGGLGRGVAVVSRDTSANRYPPPPTPPHKGEGSTPSLPHAGIPFRRAGSVDPAREPMTHFALPVAQQALEFGP